MHFTCIACKQEYCYFCEEINFKNRSDRCVNRNCFGQTSLHAHHPRYCFYYLRDLDVVELQNLLTVKWLVYRQFTIYNIFFVIR